MDELVSRYKDRVYQLSVWQVGVEHAEDLAQEVFVEIFRSIARFRGESRFSTWLVSVVRNVGRGYRRRLGRERARMAPVTMEVLEELPAKGQDPASGLSRGELRRRLKQAMARLSDEHRDTMILREWEGLSYQEIADTLSIPVGTVRSRLNAARSHLARWIGRRHG